MPPARPAALDASPKLASVETPASEAAIPTAAPPMGTIVPLNHPLPPSRSSVLAFATQAEVDTMPTGSVVPAPGKAAIPVPRAVSEKERLDALFETAALVPAHLKTVPIKVASAVRTSLPALSEAVIVRPAAMAGHFRAPDARSTPNHFSGKAIVPPTSLGFTATQ